MRPDRSRSTGQLRSPGLRNVVEPPTLASVLVIGPAWVGDMVLAHSLLQVIAARHPGCRIGVVAPSWTLPLLRFMPEVGDAIELPVGHGELGLGHRYRLARTLRDRGYDVAIVLPNSFKSALVPFWARIPRRVGYARELRGPLLTDRRRIDRGSRPHQALEFAALALPGDAPPPTPLPLPRLAVPPDAAFVALAALGLAQPERPVLALVPGAEYGPAKRWPDEHFADLARKRAAAGWIVWLLGSRRDRPAAERVQALSAGACIDLAGRTTLDQAICLLSLASAAVTNDSGLMHVAAALGRPQVAVFGPSDPQRTAPLNDRAHALFIDLPCRPCGQRTCPLGHHKCLRDLAPDRVLEALSSL